MLWLCLQFPLLPLEVFTRSGSVEDTRAVVVVHRHRVLCSNTPAQSRGVAQGISPATAQALCNDLRVIERAPAMEDAALTGIADWAYGFSSHVSPSSSGRLLLEVGASLGLFGGIAALLGRMEDELGARRWTHRCGLAPTPLAAELLAVACPYTAARPPDWLGSGTRAFADTLNALPLELLEAPEREQLAMQRMGMHRIGELLALPRAALGRRFGKAFLQYLMRLTGESPDPRPVHRPREHFESTLHFLEPLPDAAMLLPSMHRLLGELSQFLQRRQVFCQRLEWQFSPAHGTVTALPISCSLEHHRENALLELTQLALERLRLPGPTLAITLYCRDFAAIHGQGSDLFDEHHQGSVDAERRLLDRLRLRLGDEGLHDVFPADAHLPERAWSNTTVPEASPVREQRPCWLLREPEPVAYAARGLAWQDRPLELLGGPERIESQWWDVPQSRDYFIARTRDGVLAWVYRERASGQWFVQGFFG